MVVLRAVGEPKTTPPHAEEANLLLARLAVDPGTGLSEEEVAERLARDGKNELPHPPRPNPLVQLAAQFTNPIVATLLVAAVIALINGARTQNETMLVR